MTILQFPRWRPDIYNVDSLNDTAGEAKNVLLSANGYVPWPSAQDYTPSAGLGATCLGAVVARDTDGATRLFAGTQTALFKYGGGSFGDVTRSSGGAYNVPTDDRWGLAVFDDTLIAVNGSDAPQSIDIVSGANFAALGGSPPTARKAVTIGRLLALYGLADNPNRLQWSGRGDPTFWTPGQRDSGYEDFPDGGKILAVSPLQSGYIFQESAIRRYVPVDSRAVFNFAKIENRGIKGPDALVVVGGTAFYPSEDGFFAKTGLAESVPIGAEKIDRWFASNAQYDRLYYMCGAADPTGRRVFWAFASSGNSTDTLDMCVCYDRYLQDWTYATDFDTTFLFAGRTPSVSVDNLDMTFAQDDVTIDNYPVSFDSQAFAGGAPYLSGFDGSTNSLKQHTGSPRAGVIETADWRPIPTGRAYVQGCYALTDVTGDYSDVTIALGRKETPQGSVTFGTAQEPNESRGYAPIRGSTRYARVRMSLASGATWNFARGVDIEVAPEGEI